MSVCGCPLVLWSELALVKMTVQWTHLYFFSSLSSLKLMSHQFLLALLTG